MNNQEIKEYFTNTPNVVYNLHEMTNLIINS